MSAPAAHAGAPLALSGWLPAWDMERRRVDLRGVVDWVRTELSAEGIDARELGRLPVSGAQARALAQRLTRRSLCVELRRPLHRALRSLLPQLPWDRVWVQVHAHFRILVPGDAMAAVPPHTDFGFGHSLAERNVWLALTDAVRPGALGMWSLERSLRWQARTSRIGGVLDELDELDPVTVRRDDALLFTPLHVHRGLMPADGTRVSIDLRLVPGPTSRRDLTFGPTWSAT